MTEECMNCSNCLSALTAEARFCPTCGMAVGAPAVAPAPAVAAAPVAQQQVPVEVPPVYQQQYAAPAPKQTNGLAIASLVLGLTGISIVGLVLGYVARKQIRESNGRQDGSGFATAGIVLGWIGTILGVLLIAAYVVFIVWAVQSDPHFFDSDVYY
jgi:uncharacterized membrane protein YeaQ/YmgE (transglycosylase-associated protein family)